MFRSLLALLVALSLAVPQLAQASLWFCRADRTVHMTCCCEHPTALLPSIDDGCCERASLSGDGDDDLGPPLPLGLLPVRWNLVGALGPPMTHTALEWPRALPVPAARGPPLYLAHASLLR